MKTKGILVIVCLIAITAFSLVGPGIHPLVAAENEQYKAKTYDGYLFAKLDNIGTKSEGPAYYLQLWDDSEIHVIKHGILWQRDPELDKLLNTKVSITGDLENGELTYTEIRPLER